MPRGTYMIPPEPWWRDDRRVLQPDGLAPSRYVATNEPPTSTRALQLTHFDPGNAAYRYHSAANVAGHGVRSAFVRFGHTNPLCDLRQWDGDCDRPTVEQLFHSAHVVHAHMDFETLMATSKAWIDPYGPEDALAQGLGLWPRSDQLLVHHYHGSHPNPSDEKAPPLVDNRYDDDIDAVQVGARLYHQRFSSRMHWLPIPVPCDDYAAMVSARDIEHRVNSMRDPKWRLRVAHSPTNPRIKGSLAFQHAIIELQARGLPVENVTIRGMSHADALALKATCDVTFDSFWLGIQGSGLEAAAMGQAVIAGDVDVKAEYERAIGYCPYTFVETFEDLRSMIERLATDDAFRLAEAARVSKYVRQHHDYPAVGYTYWNIIQHEAEARNLAWAFPPMGAAS